MRNRWILLAICLIGFFALNSILTPDSHWSVELIQFIFGMGIGFTLVSMASLYDKLEEDKHSDHTKSEF